ncbi:histidine phosphatase family protein [Thioalkalivibrio sp. XN8]|uniref:SixA phosphatase family protein n=1 Tax=Thioalkalivibrio sp. XN8 TaxID=2712863 RepID=UPI0013EB4AD8|nr:histidine phosphatase family protein [Thioalkalivibrio sp. XN8]NGP54316.1 histidine phosphatase family protein [Thioalkalivibrio sp. XN8]
MLQLILLRHGKSSWDDARLDDFDRPLAPRGLRNVPEMGRRLARRGPVPGLVVSSPAVRALATARGVAREVGYREDRIREAPELYLATPDEILAVVHATPAGVDALMVVGHNPGLTELANRLDDIRLDNMPTAAMLCVEFDAASWADIRPANAELCWFDYPKKQPG